jgi:hypothetical protein
MDTLTSGVIGNIFKLLTKILNSSLFFLTKFRKNFLLDISKNLSSTWKNIFRKSVEYNIWINSSKLQLLV